MFDKKLSDLNFEDLQRLIENKVREGKNIEYKAMLPGNSDHDRKEFLKDISSFANTDGGYLIYGIEEKKGAPVRIRGLDIDDPDAILNKYDNQIKDNIEPRITIQHRFIHSEGKSVLIFEIKKSWQSPHRVTFSRHGHFYARNSSGVYSLDTAQLRSAFNLSENLLEKIDDFLLGRISQLEGNKGFAFLKSSTVAVLHLLPFSSFEPDASTCFPKMLELSKNNKIHIIEQNVSRSKKINFEGVLDFTHDKSEYVQIYRNGIIESVSNASASTAMYSEAYPLQIPSIALQKNILEAVRGYLKNLQQLDFQCPVAISLTLLNVKGYKLAIASKSFSSPPEAIEKNILQFPLDVIYSYETKVEDILRPTFDQLWNACGYKKSPNFDDKNNWID